MSCRDVICRSTINEDESRYLCEGAQLFNFSTDGITQSNRKTYIECEIYN